MENALMEYESGMKSEDEEISQHEHTYLDELDIQEQVQKEVDGNTPEENYSEIGFMESSNLTNGSEEAVNEEQYQEDGCCEVPHTLEETNQGEDNRDLLLQENMKPNVEIEFPEQGGSNAEQELQELKNNLKTLYEQLKEALKFFAEEILFNCKICQEKFIRRKLFKQHMKNHKRNMFYQCSQCNKNFKHKRHLKLHTATHFHEDYLQG